MRCEFLDLSLNPDFSARFGHLRRLQYCLRPLGTGEILPFLAFGKRRSGGRVEKKERQVTSEVRSLQVQTRTSINKM